MRIVLLALVLTGCAGSLQQVGADLLAVRPVIVAHCKEDVPHPECDAAVAAYNRLAVKYDVVNTAAEAAQ